MVSMSRNDSPEGRREIYSAAFNLALTLEPVLTGFPEKLNGCLSEQEEKPGLDKQVVFEELKGLLKKPLSLEVLKQGVELCETLSKAYSDLKEITTTVNQAKEELANVEKLLSSAITDDYNPSLEEFKKELHSIDSIDDSRKFEEFFLPWWKDKLQSKNPSASGVFAPAGGEEEELALSLPPDAIRSADDKEQIAAAKETVKEILQAALKDARKTFSRLPEQLLKLRQKEDEFSDLLGFLANYDKNDGKDFLTREFIQKLKILQLKILEAKGKIELNERSDTLDLIFLLYESFESICSRLLDDFQEIDETLNDHILLMMRQEKDPELSEYERFLKSGRTNTGLLPPVPQPTLLPSFPLPADDSVQTHLYLLNNGEEKFAAADVVAEIVRHGKRHEFVYIFPGNSGHHQKRCNLLGKKTGSGLAEIAGDLYDSGVPTLSLNTMLNDDLITKGRHIDAMRDVAIAVLANYSLFSILRDTSTDENFPILLEIDRKNYGLSLYGGVNKDINYDIVKFYTTNYKLLLEFIDASKSNNQGKMRQCLEELNTNLYLEKDLDVQAKHAQITQKTSEKIFIVAQKRYQKIMGITMAASSHAPLPLPSSPSSNVESSGSTGEADASRRRKHTPSLFGDSPAVAASKRRKGGAGLTVATDADAGVVAAEDAAAETFCPGDNAEGDKAEGDDFVPAGDISYA